MEKVKTVLNSNGLVINKLKMAIVELMNKQKICRAT